MKKIIAVFLTLLLLLGSLSISAFAEVSQNKITYSLLQKMEVLKPEDVISVYISFSGDMKRKDDMPSWPDKIKAAQEYKEYIAERNKTIFAQVFDGLDVEILCDIFGNMVIANVKVSDINTIAKYDIVQDIDFYDEQTPVAEPSADKDLFKNLFWEEYKDEIDPNHMGMEETLSYGEKYYHYSKSTGQMDWALIFASSNMAMPWCIYGHFGEKVIRPDYEAIPFSFFYCIFDVEKQEFFSLEDAYDNRSQYEDFEEYVGDNIGERIGDVDGDGNLSIVDATTIQKCLAEVIEFSREDEVDGRFYRLYGTPVYYISDFNLDSKRDIVDATCIQKHLAGLPYDNRTIVYVNRALYNVYSNNQVSAHASNGRAPYQYKFTIIGGVHAYSKYGEDFGDFKVDTSNIVPGEFKITTGYIDSNSVLLPTKSITYGDEFTLIVTAKDAKGDESKPVEVTFINADNGEPPTELSTGIYE